MASQKFGFFQDSAMRRQQPKERRIISKTPLIKANHSELGDESSSTDDESFVLVLMPERSADASASPPTMQANERESNAKLPGIPSKSQKETRSPTYTRRFGRQHNNRNDDLENMSFGNPFARPAEMRNPVHPMYRLSRQCHEDELGAMSSGVLFNSAEDLRDPTFLTRQDKYQDDNIEEDDDLDLMSGGIIFGSIEELRDPTALRKIALGRTATW